jgi:hypothetical protein
MNIGETIGAGLCVICFVIFLYMVLFVGFG